MCGLVPFSMAPINTKNVHRTNFLLGHLYGKDFVYDEMMIAPGFGEIARVATETFATMVSFVVTGDRDPGYGSTSKMIAESALCLVRDVQGEGGIWTPGALIDDSEGSRPLKPK